MMKVSLILNVLVLVPVCYGMMTDAKWVVDSYGSFSAARGILLAIYLAILLASILLFFYMDPKYVLSLLFIQIIYKITTPLTAGTVGNPVVICNLLIAMLHSVTAYTIWHRLST